MKHFVLVHGAGHGAWCWFKITAMLEAAGHNVTTVDLAASGINPKQVNEISSLQEYVEPLMEVMGLIPEGERVVLVSHSYGGLAAIIAVERFAEKIAVGVYVSSVVVPPDSTLFEYFSQPSKGDRGCMYDTKYFYDDGPDHGPTSIIFGPQMLAHRLYQNCPLEDLKLATVLLRPTRTFKKENMEDVRFTKDRYGSVPRVFAICGDDMLSNKENQQAMIERAEVDEVDVIQGADHMVMLSKPKDLFDYLLKTSGKYI